MTALEELLAVTGKDRDDLWEERFFKELSTSSVTITREDPVNGPDSWPYLLAETSPQGSEPFSKIINWLSTRGIGLVVNSHRTFPDYVFSYGMIWSFKETGLFFKRDVTQPSSEITFEEGQKILAGPPTQEFLPDYVRKILKDFFVQQTVLQPRVLVMSTDRENFDLAFSLESLGNPPEHEHEGILEAVSWFLPPHYSLIAVSEEGLPQFHPL